MPLKDNELDMNRQEHRYCRCNNIEEGSFFFEDRFDDYYLSWKEYEHLAEELDAAGMTCDELAAYLPFFGLYSCYSCWWNPSDTRYRRNKNRHQFWDITNLSNKAGTII